MLLLAFQCLIWSGLSYGEWEDTTWADHPFMVQVRTEKSGSWYICGGSIISKAGYNGNGVILTAAHCVDGATQVDSYIGCTSTACNDGATKYDHQSIVIHDDYAGVTSGDDFVDNDIALVYLTQPITHANAEEIPLHPTMDAVRDNSEIKTLGYYGTCAGYGNSCVGGSDTDTLEYQISHFMPTDECDNTWGSYVTGAHDFCVKDDVADSAGEYTGACAGDSGSPLVFEGRQLGLVSWGHKYCDPAMPSVAASIPMYFDWIKTNCPACIYTFVDIDVSGTDLGECQGDCDSDAECSAGLLCYQREGDGATPAGCQGSATNNWDYCFDEARAFVDDVHVDADNLVECQGDCDSDADCIGNLKCYQRDGDAPNPPGCQGSATDNWDYCFDEQRAFVGDAHVSGTNLDECQGDCDSDADCIGNLICFQRTGNAPNAPGCQGSATNNWDYCFNEQRAFVSHAHVHGTNLAECQGDCDSDADCIGNLKCYQRNADAPNPPGCQGSATNNWDYCFDAARAFVGDVHVSGKNLDECQGDCDSDADCIGNLQCFQRTGNAPNAPGCQGNPTPEWDYCFDEQKVFVGDTHVSGTNLAECQGDCDSDDDCIGNLKCYQRDGDVSNAPGCQGNPTTNWDYCFDEHRAFVGDVHVSGKNLDECQGDCDSDEDCIGNLICFQRTGNAPNAPGCQGNPTPEWDYCFNEQRAFISDTHVHGTNLAECQGDCDSDDDCIGNLVCLQRTGDEPIPPGCQGSASDNWDYCYDPSRAYVGDVHVSGKNLGECQGDCDTNDDCIGNLQCFQRNGNAANAPGCQGTPRSGWDYCFDPSKQSSSNYLFDGFVNMPGGSYYLYALTAVVVVLVFMNIYWACRFKKLGATNTYKQVSMEASDTEIDC